MMRLQKFLAKQGFGSRRFCETLITDGKIKVNDKIAELGMSIDEHSDTVTIDNMPIKDNITPVVYALHKPKGIETTCNRKPDTILHFVPETPLVFPVGRLDKESCGLILLTNSGALTQRLTHPSFQHEKEYHVRVSSPLSTSELEMFSTGIIISGKKTLPAKIRPHGHNRYSVILTEGRNRQIRKMMRALGKGVVSLKRVRIESINLGDLEPGEYRIMRPDEYQHLIKD